MAYPIEKPKKPRTTTTPPLPHEQEKRGWVLMWRLAPRRKLARNPIAYSRILRFPASRDGHLNVKILGWVREPTARSLPTVYKAQRKRTSCHLPRLADRIAPWLNKKRAQHLPRHNDIVSRCYFDWAKIEHEARQRRHARRYAAQPQQQQLAPQRPLLHRYGTVEVEDLDALSAAVEVLRISREHERRLGLRPQPRDIGAEPFYQWAYGTGEEEMWKF